MATLSRRLTQLGPGSEHNSEGQNLTSPADDTDANLSELSWRQFLFRDARVPAHEQSLRTDLFCSLVLLACWITVFIVVTVIMVRDWPVEAKVFKSNNAITQEGYTCDCSLPPNLQVLESTSTKSPLTNLNQCYRRSSIETIRVLQYPRNYAEFDAKVQQLAASEVKEVESEGYVVRQEERELSVGNDLPLSSIYRNEVFNTTSDYILFPLNYIGSADFMTFPPSYLRMAFKYTCGDCSLCGLNVMNDLMSNVTGRREPSWGSCYYWVRLDRDQCNKSSELGWSYTGKCVLYPTNTLPFSFAIRKFVERVRNFAAQNLITDIGTVVGDYHNHTSVQPNVVFMSNSTVMKSSLPYGFVESPRGSALHAWLVNSYPGLDTECSEVPDLRYNQTVCNGSSICNAFARTDVSRSIDLKCLSMTNATECVNLVSGNLLIDNNFGSDVGVDEICHKRPFSCLSPSFEMSKVPAYKVFRYVDSHTNSTDPLATYLNWSTFQNEWLLGSGICTNTYEQVYRYNKTWFLQTECINGTDLCTLTGTIHHIDDFHDTEKALLPTEMFHNGTEDGKLFVCYKIREKPFSLWFLNYINVLFSWLGVLVLIYVSGIYKLYRFLHAKYARKEDRPAAINCCTEVVHSFFSWCTDIFLKITCSSPRRVDMAATSGTSTGVRPQSQRWRKASARHVATFVASLQRRLRRVRAQRAAGTDEAGDRLHEGPPSVQLGDDHELHPILHDQTTSAAGLDRI